MTLAHQYTENDSIIVSQKAVFKGYFEVHELKIKFRLFEGGWSNEITREVFKRGHATCVLLYDSKRDTVVLVEQFRVGGIGHPISPWLFELVAGIIEPDETPEEVAHREAKEEAGCTILQLLPICNYLVSPGGTDERVHLYCGMIDSEGVNGFHGLEHENEDIKVHVLPVEEAFSMVREGRIDNAAAIIALQWLELRYCCDN